MVWSDADPLEFGEEGDAARQYLLNPAIFGLLGDVRGRRVLDAGCGQGYLSRMLARRGAMVTGVEPAENFFRYAVEREAGERLGIAYLQADLSTLSAASSRYDAVIANMVFMDIPDFEIAMRACVSALRHGGLFIFSLLHPCFDAPYDAPQPSPGEAHTYFDRYAAPQRRFGDFFHRPLSIYLNLLLDVGCALGRIEEPRLGPELAATLGAEREACVPAYIVISATK